MKKVQLTESQLSKDPMLLTSLFIKAAHAQDFDIDWIEAVLTEAVANNCVNFLGIMMEYIEIIPAQPPVRRDIATPTPAMR